MRSYSRLETALILFYIHCRDGKPLAHRYLSQSERSQQCADRFFSNLIRGRSVKAKAV